MQIVFPLCTDRGTTGKMTTCLAAPVGCVHVYTWIKDGGNQVYMCLLRSNLLQNQSGSTYYKESIRLASNYVYVIAGALLRN